MPFSIINTITSWFLKKRIHQIELFKKYPIPLEPSTHGETMGQRGGAGGRCQGKEDARNHRWR